MRIYIAGPMTGFPDHNAPAFFEAKKRLREQGHFVINPIELSAMFGNLEEIEESFAWVYGTHEGVPIVDYHLRDMIKRQTLAKCVMDADLAALHSCDAIYLLDGWESSRGAKAELAEALKHGLEVRQEGGAE